jgi:iron complex transport system substrate-binding protein
VVASVRRSVREAPPEGIVDLGSAHAPSLERLAAATPDVVVGDRALHAVVAPRLEAVHADVVLVDTSSVDGTLDGLREVGRRLDAADRMDQEIAGVRRALAEAVAARGRRVLLVFGTPESFMVMTKHTWLGDLAAQMGMENLATGLIGTERHPGFVEVNDEALAKLDPDVVLLVTHGAPDLVRDRFAQRFSERGVWQDAAGPAAVRILPHELFGTNPGLALADAARVLGTMAAPGAAR